MSNDNNISLPNYIMKSMIAAWKMVQINPKAMEYFDLSSDGFWKSFWAIAVMLPGFFLWAYFNMKNGPQLVAEGIEVSYPIIAEGLYFLTALPFTAFVMVYFTKFMKIDENFASMVIAYNWVNALSYLILTAATMILTAGIVGVEIGTIIVLMLRIYFGFYVIWALIKMSLKISGMLSVGVVLFLKLFDASAQLLFYRIFNPEYFELFFAVANNPPA